MLVISPLTGKVRRVAYQSRSVILKLWAIHPRIGFTGGTVVKNLPANAGDERDAGLIFGSGRFPGVGNGNPLQYSCPESSMNRGAWQATIHRVAQSQTGLSTHVCTACTAGCITAYPINIWYVTPEGRLDPSREQMFLCFEIKKINLSINSPHFP